MRFHPKVEARQRLDDSECRTRYWERLRTRDQQQQQEEEEGEGKTEEVEVDGLRYLIRMVKERQEPGADMDGVNDSEHSTGEREQEQATNSDGDGFAERRCMRSTRSTCYTRYERMCLDMRMDESLSTEID